MGTLYNCLREVRLEKYYPAFRANGITCYESLASLSMTELCAMGISGADDRRRLVELVNIIKSVNRENTTTTTTTSAPTTTSTTAPLPRKRQPGSPTPSTASARSALSAAGGGGTYSSSSAGSQSEKKVPRRHPLEGGAVGGVGGGSNNNSGNSGTTTTTTATTGATNHLSGLRLEPTRDVSVRERGPNFSVGSYLDMLEFMSDSSGHSTDGGDHLDYSLEGDAPTIAHHPRTQPPVFSRNPAPRKLPSADRGGGVVRSQTRSKGYNYGVPGSRESSSASAKPSRTRGGGASGGGGRTTVTKDERIRVCVRKRPPSRRESRASDADIVEANSTTTVIVKEPKVAVDLTAFTMKHEFVFDEVFDESCSNEDVYIRAARPLITTVFHRSNATFFAYGQTGAGKTHTMIGNNGVPGLYQLAAQDVFDIMASGQYGTDLHVWVSFFEIYCGQLFDLLNRRNRLVAREDGAQRVCIAGLTETEVPDVQMLIRVLQFGNSVRSRGTSGVNPDSSRSHAVLQMEVRRANDTILGKISFIDLAGSERASDMGDPDKQTRMEGAEINQSLLALKECIRSIDQESRHTPFRQSKLTHILKDAFVGNSRTCMIANLSPVQSACEHTLNTLRYADRVKELRHRDSSQTGGVERGGGGGGGATFGQAMNLLMNIPITAPSIFHPSNLLSTSTPVRPRLGDPHHHHPPYSPSSSSAADAGDITLDPSETPIRGHNVFTKSSGSRIRSSRPQSENLSARGRGQSGGGNARLPYSGAAASQGVLPPHPEASPSESDHTDTDSNNVTHPTTSEGRPQASSSSRPSNNMAVVGSTDTEFDFPTSDFNNVYDDDQQQLPPQRTPQLNDLSHQGRRNDLSGVKARRTPELKEQAKGQGDLASAASSAAASGPGRYELHRVQSWERRASNPSPTNQLSGRSSKSQSSHSLSPALGSRHGRTSNPSPSTERLPPTTSTHILSSAMGELGNVSPVSARGRPTSAGPVADSFDDELLFGEGRSAQVPGGDQASSSNRQVMKVLPGLQTALSSDLASFSQRSPLRSGGGVEKTGVTTSPADVACPAPSFSRNNVASPSPRHEEGSTFTRGAGSSRDPTPQGGKTITSALSSPTCAAVKDWVSQRTDSELVSVRSMKRRTEKPTETTGNLPFAAYSTVDPSPRNPVSSAQERLQGNVWDSSAVARPSSSRELSGPSSDPVVGSNLVTAAPAVHSARDSRPSSTSSRQGGGAPSADSHSGRSMAWSDNSATTTTSTRTAPSSALVTEKLMSGAVFSPIHPQPVSTTGGVQPVTLRGGLPLSSGSGIVHPTPVVCGVPSSVSVSSFATSASVTSSASFSMAERDKARVSLVGCHEDQLAAITSLCKQEMKLLLSAKKAVPRSFDDYLGRVGAILCQKMAAIQQLQDSIHGYQTRFSLHPHTPSSTNPAAGASASSSSDVAGHLLPPS